MQTKWMENGAMAVREEEQVRSFYSSQVDTCSLCNRGYSGVSLCRVARPNPNHPSSALCLHGTKPCSTWTTTATKSLPSLTLDQSTAARTGRSSSFTDTRTIQVNILLHFLAFSHRRPSIRCVFALVPSRSELQPAYHRGQQTRLRRIFPLLADRAR